MEGPGDRPFDRLKFSGTLPGVAVCGVLGLLLWPVLLGDQTLFYRDLYLQYIGTGRILHSGAFSASLTWDPILNGGQPLLGNPNRFVLYPSRILYLIMNPTSGLNWEISIHFLLGAVGAVQLARRLGLSRAGSAVAGLSYSLSGLSISIASHLGRLMAYHWVPWVVLAVHAGLCEKSKKSWRWQLAIPLCFLAQWLTGTAESVALTAVMAVGWVATLHFGQGSRYRVVIRSCGLVALGVGLAAIQILPAAEMVYRSDRASYAEIGATVDWSLHPLRIPEILIPGYCGPIDEVYNGSHYWGARLFNRGVPLVVSIYLGISVAFLALIGWIRSTSDPMWRSLRLFLSFFAGGAVLLAFGEYVPFIGRAWATVPGFNVVRFPVKMILVVGLPVALWAGRGLDAWLGCRQRTARRLGFGTLMGALLFFAIAWGVTLDQAVTTLGLLFPDRGEMAADGLYGQLVHVGLILAALAPVGLLSGRATKRLLAVLATVVVAADLVIAAIPFLPMGPRELLDEPPELVEKVRNQLSAGRFFRDPDREVVDFPYVVDRAWEGAEQVLRDLSFSVAATYLVPMVYNFDTAGLAYRRMAILEFAAGEAGWRSRAKLFQAAAVEVVLTPDAPDVANLEFVSEYRPDSSAPLFLYRVIPRPRMARWVGSGRTVSSPDDALDVLVNSEFDPTVEVLRETTAPISPAPSPFWLQLTPESEIWRQEIMAPMVGFITTAVPWHPGIVVRVDGRLVPVEQVNFAFAGFEVGPGRHDIVITFAPRSVLCGGMVAVLSIIIWSLVAITMWRSRGRRLFQSPTESSRAKSPRST